MKTNDNVATWRMILRCRSRLTDTRWRRFTCQRKINKIKSLLSGESTLDLCYANQRKFRSDTYRPRHATENCRNHHCGDDSIVLANVTRDPGLLAWVRWGPRSGGSALLVVSFSVLVSILLCSLSMSVAALSTRLTRALRLRGSCS